MLNKPCYINSSGKKVLQYVSSDTIAFNTPFILTCGKRLTKNMPYMKLEKLVAGYDIKAIRLLDFEQVDSEINIYVQELADNKLYTLAWNLEANENYWL